MTLPKQSFIVKTLAGDYVAVRNSIQMARGDARKTEELTGMKCVILRIAILEEITV